MKYYSTEIAKISNFILVLFIGLAIGTLFASNYFELSDGLCAILIICSGLFIIIGFIVKVLLVGFSIIVKNHEISIKEKTSIKK